MISYRFPVGEVKDTNDDYLAFGFRTSQERIGTMMLFRVESSTGVDSLEVQLVRICILCIADGP